MPTAKRITNVAPPMPSVGVGRLPRGGRCKQRPPDSRRCEDAMIRKVAALLAYVVVVSALGGTARADFLYSGEAYGAFAPGVVAPPIADTGPLPSAGGM